MQETATKQIAMNRVVFYIAQIVNLNGFVADSAYTLTYYVWNALTGLTGLFVRVFNVTPEELRPYRQINPSATLQTAVTNICNAKCVFCVYPKAVTSGAIKSGVMPFDIFKKVVDEWAALGGKSLDLTPTVGDTLIDPGLLKKIEYAVCDARIENIVLTTNGILLNKNNIYRSLIDVGLTTIFISTQGTSREIYSDVYGVDRYDDVISGIRNLLEYNRSCGNPTHIGIRFRNAQKPSEILRSRDFIENIRPYLCRQVTCNFTADYDNWGGAIAEKDIMGFMRLRKLPSKVDVPCAGLFAYTVSHDGQVRLCGCRFKSSDSDDMVVGNVEEQSLEEISRSERAWNIISSFYSGQRPETCDRCTLYHPITRGWLKKQSAGIIAGMRPKS